MAEISVVESRRDFDRLGQLFREYQADLGIDLCFQNFEQELNELPVQYGPPGGRAYLARDNGDAIGCVAVRALASGVCEMKRMYIRAGYRGTGLGRELAETIIQAGRELGYDRMRLDTLTSMAAAAGLYRTLGFEPIDPYRPNPLEKPMFFELDLQKGR